MEWGIGVRTQRPGRQSLINDERIPCLYAFLRCSRNKFLLFLCGVKIKAYFAKKNSYMKTKEEYIALIKAHADFRGCGEVAQAHESFLVKRNRTRWNLPY